MIMVCDLDRYEASEVYHEEKWYESISIENVIISGNMETQSYLVKMGFNVGPRPWMVDQL